MIHTGKGFSVVNEADVFLECFHFFYGTVDVGNLISGSSAFSKSISNIWKFMLHILLEASFQGFERYLSSMWNECNCEEVRTFFGIALLGIRMKTFSSSVATAEFSKFAGIQPYTFFFFFCTKCIFHSLLYKANWTRRPSHQSQDRERYPVQRWTGLF